jgi:osmotically-inducible protein OsmY
VKIKIGDELRRNGEMDAEHVTVEISGGNVTLRRSVRSRGEKKPYMPVKDNGE